MKRVYKVTSSPALGTSIERIRMDFIVLTWPLIKVYLFPISVKFDFLIMKLEDNNDELNYDNKVCQLRAITRAKDFLLSEW